MKPLHWLIVATIGLLSGCVSVRSSTVPGTNLYQYRTYAWIEPADPNAARIQRSPAGQTIRNQIGRNLHARGIVEATQGQQPDFLVAYHVILQEKVDVWNYGGGWEWGWGWGWGGGPSAYEYTQGTIVVDFIDPRTNQVFWRGSASRVVDNPENPDLNSVASSVDKMMKKYPAQMAAIGAPPSG